LEPDEFKAMIEAVRIAEQALGQARYGVTEHDAASRAFRRSLFVVRDVKEGAEFTPENIRSIRPGNGLAPKHLQEVLGKRAVKDISAGTPLGWDIVSG
jgi:N-acetylneuraminate synthase